MLRLSNIRIPVRIAAACLLPVLAFTVFAGKDLLEKWVDSSKSNQMAALADATPATTALIHELQVERGTSTGFINSNGKSFGDQMRRQRPLVDTALATWQQRMAEFAQAHPGSDFARDVEGARQKLAGLAATRSRVDSSILKASEAFDFYSSITSLLASSIDEMGELTENARVARQAIVLGAHVRRKEWAGQERATGVGAIASGELTSSSYFQIVRMRAIQDSQFATFRRNATPAQAEYVQNALKGPVVDDLTRLRDIIYASPFTKSLDGVTAAQWFDVTTRYMDVLKTLEDRLTGDFTAIVRSIASDARWGFWGLMSVFLVLVAITGVLSTIVMLSITRPIAQLVGTMGELAQGHNDIEVPGADRGDELGHMARAVLVFRDAALEKIRLEGQTEEQRKQTEDERRRNSEVQAQAAEVQAGVVRALAEGLNRLTQGDLTFRLSDGFPESYKQIRDDFNRTIAQLQDTIRAIAAATREVASTAAEISSSTTDLSQRTEEQAASLEQTSASMEEISATVKKNAENAQQANQFASGTREVADRGGAVVAQAVSAMARIEDSSRKISDIISVIDEIARQTNLLALNAAVEAARTGEAGRGFAVVASEVRSLAQRSSQAAKDIKDLITNSSSQVQEGVDLVNKAGASLSEIVASIKKVAEIVSDIAAASGEQSTGIDQVNTALTQMDQVTQQNSAVVEQNAAASKALEQQSQTMEKQVSVFRFEDGRSAQTAPAAAMPTRRPAAVPAKPASQQKQPAAKRGVNGRQPALASATGRDWKEF